jgi:hypothetical protein
VISGEFYLPRDGTGSVLERGPAEVGCGMVLGGGLGAADRHGAAHAAPGALGLVVLIVVVVVVLILSKRGK